MDVGNYWQENKRFLIAVGIGVAVFAGGWAAIDSYLGAELRAQRARKSRIESDLRAELYTAADLERASAQNQALLTACEALRKSLEFVPRPEFRMEKGVSATSRYFNAVERTREDLTRRAGRAGLALPPESGMPLVSPTKDAELTRYLEALDAIEQTVSLAIQSGCERIEKIGVKLDPSLLSGKPISGVERTTIEFNFVGSALPLTQLLCALQDPRNQRVLAVERVSIAPARTKNSDDVKLELVLLVAHLNQLGVPSAAEAAQ